MGDKTRLDQVSIRELRGALAAILNKVVTRGQITYITNHGRRIAAIVPVAAAEQLQQQREGPTQ